VVAPPSHVRRPSTAPVLLRAWIARSGPALGLLLVILIFALLTDAPGRYLSAFNLRIVLSQTVIVALGAIGMTMIIVSGGIDLSVGASIALTGVICATCLQAGWPPALAVLAAVLAGGVVGFINGAMITADSSATKDQPQGATILQGEVAPVLAPPVKTRHKIG